MRKKRQANIYIYIYILEHSPLNQVLETPVSNLFLAGIVVRKMAALRLEIAVVPLRCSENAVYNGVRKELGEKIEAWGRNILADFFTDAIVNRPSLQMMKDTVTFLVVFKNF